MDEDEELRESENLEEIIRAAAGDAAVHVTDGESVDDVRDYGRVLDALDAISGGVLGITARRFEEGATRTIVLERGARAAIELRLEGDTDWIDHPVLVEQLDRALEADGAPGRFYAFCSRSWGQEVGFAYLPKAEGERIAELVAAREEIAIFEDFFPKGRQTVDED
ncbi:hypothetical protein [Sorangium sp. So ce1097]|uniref:hypothetical protein n=1 Tax=Sorangium sp. So ce1097 TaxID=3133330 RepID=UPI003F6422CC